MAKGKIQLAETGRLLRSAVEDRCILRQPHDAASVVVVPLAAPRVFTAGILSFVNSWDGFLLALSLNSNPNFRTLLVGITRYQGELTFPWPIISAALGVAIVPIAVLIATFRERVVVGLKQGGLRG